MSFLRMMASLRLTVALLALSMFLVLAGTLAQTSEGVWSVVDRYFRSPMVVVPLQLFVPEKVLRVPLAIPFPGGLTLGVLLFVNLIGAHATRFKFQARRIGIIMTHVGVIMLLVGEFVTGVAAEEGNMTSDEGGRANYVEDIRETELAVIDRSKPESDLVVAVPQRLLAASAAGSRPITHGLLPFEIRVDEWLGNSRVLGPMQAKPAERAGVRADAGAGRSITAVAAPTATGVDGQSMDLPSAYVTLLRGGKSLGTYLVSAWLDGQSVGVEGRTYEISLRFKRTYKPYVLELIDFRHDKFVGTDKPRNFSSRVRLIDPGRNVDREVVISMNNPLRHAGETFYQSAFKPGDTGTILQVVKNPGWLIPYISCGMVTLGLLVHFGIRMGSSVRRLAS
ncbi:MAG TPA: cytochrome c biogenesis protein ResB [Phycisphaerales bacterium]|nr:cytochrome c biogenesis protein ResB [Phycisphaerales bacterium]